MCGETDSETSHRLSVQTFITIQTAAGSDSSPTAQHASKWERWRRERREREGEREDREERWTERNPTAIRIT